MSSVLWDERSPSATSTTTVTPEVPPARLRQARAHTYSALLPSGPAWPFCGTLVPRCPRQISNPSAAHPSRTQTSRAELPHALRARQPSTSGSASPGQVAWPLEAPFLHQRNGSNSDVRPQTGRHRGQALSTELWPVGAARHLPPHTHLPRGRQAAFGPAPLPGRDLKSGNQVWGQFQSLSAGHCQRRRPPQPLGP